MAKLPICIYPKEDSQNSIIARDLRMFHDQIRNVLERRIDGFNLSEDLLGDGLEFGTFTSTSPGRIINTIANTSSGSFFRQKTDSAVPATAYGLEAVVDAADSTRGRFCVVDKDNLSSQLISLVPDDPAAESNPGGRIEFPSGIGTFRTTGDFNVRISRNSILQMEFTSSQIESSANFVPVSTAGYDLGTSSLGWRSAFIDNTATSGTGLTLAMTPGSSAGVNGQSITMGANSTGYGLSITHNGSSSGNALTITRASASSGSSIAITHNANSSAITIDIDNTTNLSQTGLTITSDPAYSGTNTLSGSILSVTDNSTADVASAAITNSRILADIVYQPDRGAGTSYTDSATGMRILMNPGSANVTDGTNNRGLFIQAGANYQGYGLQISHTRATASSGARALRIDGGTSNADESVCIEMADGDSCSVSSANEGVFRYNATTQTFQVSQNTGAFASLVTSTSTGRIAQVVSTFTSAAGATTTTAIPGDDTSPRWDEGAQYMSVAITPGSSSNRILIIATAFVSVSAVAGCAGAIFVERSGTPLVATDTALASTIHTSGGAASANPLVVTHNYTPSDTTALTIYFRAGPESGTLGFNGDTSGNRVHGATNKSSIIAIEYVP